jgi:DNA/RNA endonuclease G (NUC1)
MKSRFFRALVVCAALLSILATAPNADNALQTPPFSQDWTSNGLITVSHDWSGVPGIVGHRGDGMASTTGRDPQTVLGDGSGTPVNVNANQANPNTFTTGGVAEFHVANPVVALQGSGTAQAPHIVINISTVGKSNTTVAYNLRDIDGSADNAAQPVALQYRVGTSGNYANLPSGFVADASTGPSLATLVTPVSVALPPATDDKPVVQLRIITTDAVGADEWIGIDDISITATPIQGPNPPTAPSGTGSATPSTVAPGGTTTLTVTVTPGANPASTGLTVTANLSAIGGSASQAFPGAGNTFTFDATVAPNTTDGLKTLPITITDAEGRSGPASVSVTVETPATNSTSVIVISQLYGGGGNGGATLRNDYVELYNRGTATVDIGGWSLQYASATGSGWDSQKLPLGGTIAPGEYYLIALASGGANGAQLPSASISGPINMAAAAGKVALVDSFDGLVGVCPLNDEDQRPHVMDFVGYGTTANCQEGAVKAPAPSSTTAIFRLGSGTIDTDRNGSDFVTGAPAPRSTAPPAGGGGNVALAVLSTDPAKNRVNVPRDATIRVTFTQPVEVFDPWFDITCDATGQHNSATFAGIGQVHYITPNVNFLAGELCTVTVFKDQVTDTATHTEHLATNHVWSFTVATGAAPPYPASVHVTLGNPSGAIASLLQPNNYLMEKAEFALSYNRDHGRPNWVSWHLSDEWTGFLTRVDTFRADPAVPPDADWYRVQGFDFSGSGFDRGHMTPNADRNNEFSIPINQATFLMTNMVAQSPDNNQGPWASLEGYLRSLLPANEIYVVAGGSGVGGTGSNGGTTTTLAGGHVTVPAETWKVALVLPKGENDLSRVSCTTRTIAVIMPNIQGIRNIAWETYLTTVDAVETLTTYNLFSNLPVPFQNCIEARKDGDPALPLVKGGQTITFAAPATPTYGDAPFAVSATGGASGNPVTFAASGACTAGGFNGAIITVVSAGDCTITASQAGSAAYNAATDVVRTVTVNKAGPSFSGLSTLIIEAGTPTATLGGVIGFGTLVPTGTVTITLNGVSQTVAVGPAGQFLATFVTASLAPSATPYPVGYAYSGDTNFTTAAGTGSVKVTDTTAPSISGVSASQPVLSPPNHKMIDITIGYLVAEFTSTQVCSLSVSSNETVNGQGDGNTSADWQVLGAHSVKLRAERAGGGNGRIYTITIRCTDGSGNIGSATTTVSVPK